MEDFHRIQDEIDEINAVLNKRIQSTVQSTTYKPLRPATLDDWSVQPPRPATLDDQSVQQLEKQLIFC